MLEPEILRFVQGYYPPGPPAFFADLGAQEITIGPGDVLSISVVEASAGGLFTSAPITTTLPTETGARLVTLPPMTVERTGTIEFPYVGRLKVAGHTPQAVQAMLVAGLTGKAIQPQVIVNIVQNYFSRVTVTGSVKLPGVYPLSAAGETVLQAIASAGGTLLQPSDTVLQFRRAGQERQIRLQDLIDDPAKNIHVRVGDYMNLYPKPRTYTILGAAWRDNQYPLPLMPLTLSEALADAGGMLDQTADSRGVFLFRYEPREVARRVAPAAPANVAYVPIVYQLNMKSASGMFIAHELRVRDKDLIYVPGARSVQWQKFLDIVRLTTTPPTQAAIVARTGSNF